jgi:hypothetical protein
MALQRLAYVVARAPGRYELLSSFIYAKVVVHQHLNLQLIAHKVVSVSGSQAAIHDHYSPVGDTVHAHADMLGEKVVRLSGEFKPAECDWCCDQEDCAPRCLRCAYQWGYFGF